MRYDLIVNEILRVTTWLYCFTVQTKEHRRTKRFNVAALVILGIGVAVKALLFSNMLIAYFVQLVAMTVYSIWRFRKEKLYHFSLLFALYAILNLSNFIAVIVSFPMASIMRIEMHTIEAEVLNTMIHLVAYISVAMICKKRRVAEVREITKVSRIGAVLLLAFFECIFLAMRYVGYSNENTMLYRTFLFAIAFGVIILGLWRYDKLQEQKRIQELVAYTHRTREVIPSVSRVLEKLEDMSVHVEETNKIIKELKIICNTDMEKN